MFYIGFFLLIVSNFLSIGNVIMKFKTGKIITGKLRV